MTTKLSELQRKQIIDFMREHPEEVVDLFQEILQRSQIEEISKEEYWNKKIIQLLNKIKVPISCKGYMLLREAILNGVMVYPDVKRTGEVYQEIADKHNTTISRVERVIRFAKEEVWRAGIIRKEIPEFYNLYQRPTNTVFIRMLVEHVIKIND